MKNIMSSRDGAVDGVQVVALLSGQAVAGPGSIGAVGDGVVTLRVETWTRPPEATVEVQGTRDASNWAAFFRLRVVKGE